MDNKIMLVEVEVNEMEVLEETVTPAFGIICGGGCWGIGCAG